MVGTLDDLAAVEGVEGVAVELASRLDIESTTDILKGREGDASQIISA